MRAWEPEAPDSVMRVEVARARELLGGAVTEREFQHTITDLADVGRWRWFHDHDARRNRAGLPDIVAVRAPRLVFLELKSQKGRLRPEQEAWLDELARCTTVEALCLRPSDFERAREVLL